MRNRFRLLPNIPRIPNTSAPTHILTLSTGSQWHDPIESPIKAIDQHVPYAPRSTREYLLPRLNESEVRFLDVALLELNLKLASLQTASYEKERAGRVLGTVMNRDVMVVNGILGVCVPCQGGGLATVPPVVQTAVSPLSKLSIQASNELRNQGRRVEPEISLLKLFP